MTSGRKDMDEARRLFTILEEERMAKAFNGDLDYVTDTIVLAEHILDILSWCTAPEDRGDAAHLRKWTQFWLVQSLSRRGEEVGLRSFMGKVVDTSHAEQQALADLDRAERLAAELNERYSNGIGSMSVGYAASTQFILMIRLGLYDRAFAFAQQTIDRQPDSVVGYSWLSTCYLYVHDYPRALDAANEEIKRAYNNYTGRDAFKSRASVYRAMGDEASAERDLAEAERYLPKS